MITTSADTCAGCNSKLRPYWIRIWRPKDDPPKPGQPVDDSAWDNLSEENRDNRNTLYGPIRMIRALKDEHFSSFVKSKQDFAMWEVFTGAYHGYGYFCKLRCATSYANRMVESLVTHAHPRRKIGK